MESSGTARFCVFSQRLEFGKVAGFTSMESLSLGLAFDYAAVMLLGSFLTHLCRIAHVAMQMHREKCTAEV